MAAGLAKGFAFQTGTAERSTCGTEGDVSRDLPRRRRGSNHRIRLPPILPGERALGHASHVGARERRCEPAERSLDRHQLVVGAALRDAAALEDEILVLERGRITQRGTYDDLMAVEGPFRRLATTLSGAVVRRVA